MTRSGRKVRVGLPALAFCAGAFIAYGCTRDFDALFGGCPSGFADCNPSGTVRCETSLDSDPKNCGACGNVCPSGSCAAGTCTLPEGGAGGNGGSSGGDATGGVGATAGAGASGGMGGSAGTATGGSAGSAGSGGCVGLDSGGAYRAAILADQPLAYFRLGEASGTTAFDETCHFTASYEGSPQLGQSGAITADPNTAVAFDGTGTRVRIDDPAHQLDFAGGAPFTVEAWAWQPVPPTPTNTGHHHVFNHYDDGLSLSQQVGYGLYFNATTSRFLFSVKEGNTVLAQQTASTVVISTWHYVAGVFDGTSIKIYLDGDLAGNETGDVAPVLPQTSVTFSIGNAFNGKQWFGGSVDELAIYAKALSAATIKTHYLANQ